MENFLKDFFLSNQNKFVDFQPQKNCIHMQELRNIVPRKATRELDRKISSRELKGFARYQHQAS